MYVATPLSLSEVSRHLGQRARALWSSSFKRIVPALDRASSRVQLDVPVLEALLTKLEPTLSLQHVRAEVVRVVDETADTKSFWLRPNARFGTHRPGSFVTLQLSIAGSAVQRSYSVSSCPGSDGLISITVKRVDGGLVSNWLADTVRAGHVLELSAPDGQFVLPSEPPSKLLMLSAGSGITPVMSMLRALVAARSQTQIVFLHFARSPRDIIFAHELQQLADTQPNLKIAVCVEREGEQGWSGALGRFSEAFLTEHAPEFRELDTYLCGPAGFMQAVMRSFESAGADLGRLRYERFDAALDPSMFMDHAQLIRFVRSGTESLSNRPRTILEEAERAGLQVASGCRAGNCGTCRCRKHSGVVVDVTTGVESGEQVEFIYPCISVARGTVAVDL